MQLTKEQIDGLNTKLKEIGTKILTIYNSEFSHELKQDNSPLTKADMLSHDLLVQYLREEFPTCAIISEEDEFEQHIDETTNVWVIDPLDGTKDFVNKTGEFSIMLALLDTSRTPIAGFVYAPAIDTLWYAQKNYGAYRLQNSKKTQIFTSNESTLDQARLIKSRNHFSKSDQELCDKLRLNNFIKLGSAGIKLCTIAQGDAEICFYSTSGMGIWDIAPAHIILQEAGGHIKTVKGEVLRYDLVQRKMSQGTLAINSGLKQILAHLKE